MNTTCLVKKRATYSDIKKLEVPDIYRQWRQSLQLTFAVVCAGDSRIYFVCDQQPMCSS